jgi:hypothetical protein
MWGGEGKSYRYMELAMYDCKRKVEKKKRRNECYW